MKLTRKKSEILFWGTLIAALIFLRGPLFWKNWNFQGTEIIETPTLIDLAGKVRNPEPPYLLVFWATWCKPCELELARINNLVKNKKIKPDQVYAVVLSEQRSEVEPIAKERNYLFPVVWDQNNYLSQKLQISVTPTLIIVGTESKFVWVTSGLSPLLELRLTQYLN